MPKTTQRRPTAAQKGASAKTETIRPLGELSDLVCGDQIGLIIAQFERKNAEHLERGLTAVSSDLNTKLISLKAKQLSALDDRKKRIARLDLKLHAHALNQITSLCVSKRVISDVIIGRVHTTLDKIEQLLQHLGEPDPGIGFGSSLVLTLEELLESSPSSDPRGYTPQMRHDVSNNANRVSSYVVADMRGGYYARSLRQLVDPADLAPRPTKAAAGKKHGW